MRQDDSVTLNQIGSEGGLTIYAAEYPLPGPTEGLWTQWGQGIAASNGLHYSAVGNHLGVDGNSYLFQYDPETRVLTRFMDALSMVDHQSGAWGYGKIHAQMREGACGTIWAFTYWGTRRDLVYGNGYEGDLLLQIDPAAGVVRNHGAVAGRRGVPSMEITPDGRYLVGEAVDAATDDGDLVVFDTASDQLTQRVDDPDQVGFRSLAVDAAGRVLYSVASIHLMALDAATGATSDPGIGLPGSDEGEFLRAVTPVRADGTFYGVTQESDTLFSINGDGELSVLGSSGGYTTSLAMTPDGSRIFWMPGAHGDSWQDGAVVRSLDTATGEMSDLVSLAGPFRDGLGLLPGGTYSMVYDQGRLIMGINASPLDDDSGFGKVAFVVIEGL